MCLTIRLPVSRPLESALDSAFLSSWRRNSADFTGHRARDTPHCLPVHQFVSVNDLCALKCHPCASHRLCESLSRWNCESPDIQPITDLRMTTSAALIRCNRNRKSIRTLGGAADGASVAAEGNSLGLLLDVLEELHGALQLPAVDGLSGLASVLEGDTEVGTAGAGRLGGNDLGGSVPNLFIVKRKLSACVSRPSRCPSPPKLWCMSLRVSAEKWAEIAIVRGRHRVFEGYSPS